MVSFSPPSIEDAERAAQRLKGVTIKTPLFPLREDISPAKIYLKLENIQPNGSFKMRGAFNAIDQIPAALLEKGVYTTSAGNFAQGVAWCARAKHIEARILVPDHAPDAKVRAIEALGGVVKKVTYAEWWRTISSHGHPDEEGYYIDPVASQDVIAGHGTIGLEILEDLPEVDRVIIPYGSGCLATGIGAVVRAQRPQAEIFACEVETGAPFAAALQAGEPVEIDYRPSFVDGIGSKRVLNHVWPYIREIASGAIVVTLKEIEEAIRLIWRATHSVAEGAGAASLAAALKQPAPGVTVCIISGAHINFAELTRIIASD